VRDQLDAPAIDQVLAGLEKVTRRYRAEAAAANAATG
jgi:hypothetical protein